MEQSEAIRLISDGVLEKGFQHWADLGCGSGTFTSALAGLLSWRSYIHAVDKEQQHLPPVINEVSIGFARANFMTDPLDLTGLDGILMANSLHYVRDKAALLKKLENYFTTNCRLLIVEYENRWPNPWVPYPISYLKLAELGKSSGYKTTRIGEAPSRFGGLMYSALLLKP